MKLPVFDSLAKIVALIATLSAASAGVFGAFHYIEQSVSDTNYPPMLTDSELRGTQENAMVKGIPFTEELAFKSKEPDGTLLYKGVAMAEGDRVDCYIYVCKDESKTHTLFLDKMDEFKKAGYNGPYNETKKIYWGARVDSTDSHLGIVQEQHMNNRYTLGVQMATLSQHGNTTRSR